MSDLDQPVKPEPQDLTLDLGGHKSVLAPTVQDLQTRFLYPFVFQRATLKESATALRAQTFSSRGGEKHPLWDYAPPHGFYSQPREHYQDELLVHVIMHLFPGLAPDFREEASRGCGYLRLSATAANKWFHGTRLNFEQRKTVPGSQSGGSSVELISEIGIEVFLSPQGIGVLSIAFTPGKKGLSLSEALDFNYRLAQYRRNPVAKFHKPHPKEKVDGSSTIPNERLSKIPPPPDKDAPLGERLGAAGGTFDLRELIGWILAPLEAVGMPPVATDLDELVVYSVARFGSEVEIADPGGRGSIGRFLAGLAQVEEARHVGAPSGPLMIPNAVLNANHWAAVGLLGAAHVVVDQPPMIGADGSPHEIDFNEQKVPVVRDKYFIPYLIALFQRLILNRAIEDASRIVTLHATDGSLPLAQLRDHLLEFSIGGHYTQVSARQALHRYYQVSREGLDVPVAWEEVRRTIADLDARATAERQGRLSRNVAKNLEEIKHVQEFLHLIEYFLVSVYFAHLWHMMASENEALKVWGRNTLHLNQHWFVPLGVAFFAAVGFGVVTVLNRYLRRRGHDKLPPDKVNEERI
jgi:hypothetical protein